MKGVFCLFLVFLCVPLGAWELNPMASEEHQEYIPQDMDDFEIKRQKKLDELERERENDAHFDEDTQSRTDRKDIPEIPDVIDDKENFNNDPSSEQNSDDSEKYLDFGDGGGTNSKTDEFYEWVDDEMSREEKDLDMQQIDADGNPLSDEQIRKLEAEIEKHGVSDGLHIDKELFQDPKLPSIMGKDAEGEGIEIEDEGQCGSSSGESNGEIAPKCRSDEKDKEAELEEQNWKEEEAKQMKEIERMQKEFQEIHGDYFNELQTESSLYEKKKVNLDHLYNKEESIKVTEVKKKRN